MKTVYLFDDNGVYTHSYDAQESPLEPGVYIEPVSCTSVLPPVLGANEAAQFDVENGEWVVVPDFRGQTYYNIATGAPVEITEVGEPSPDLSPTPVPTPLTKEQRIDALQRVYDSDRDQLNKAWLAVLIADGVNEAARHALIKVQMDDLDAQLEMDILSIIMEE